MAAILDRKDGIHYMEESDFTEVMSIEAREYEFGWTEGIFRDCLRVGYIGLVYMVHGRVAGYGVASARAGECHILNVCVSSDYSRQGLARALLKRLLAMAKRLKAHTAYLEVRPSNHPAFKLYMTLGFRRIGTRRDYYPAPIGREDALVLARSLRDGGSVLSRK